MKRVDNLIVGHYGSGNFGDDIMLQYLIDHFNNKKITFRVVFFGNNYEQFKLHSDQILVIDRNSFLNHFFTLVIGLIHCKKIIWGGGTCFTDEEGDGYFIGMLIAFILKRKINYKSIGIGNLNRFTRILKFKILMRLSDTVSFRDVKSQQFAESFFPKKEFLIEKDLGEVYLKSSPILSDEDKPYYLLICWRNLNSYSNYSLDSFLKVVNSILKKSPELEEIRLIDVDNIVDHKTNINLFNLLNKEFPRYRIKHNNELNYSDKINEIKQCSVVLTARLHVLIAALEYNKLVYVYSYSPKIDIVLDKHLNNSKVIRL